MKPSFSSTRAGIGGMIFALLLAAVVTALLPQRGEAQANCAACSFEANCTSFPVGANDCLQGSYWVSSDDGESGYWLDWCFTFGGQCEWLVHLDFADDGTAYVQSAPARSVHEPTRLEREEAGALSQTCDGVLLAAHRADNLVALRDDPIALTL